MTTPTKSRIAVHVAHGGYLAVLTGLTFFLIILLWGAAIYSLAEGPTGAPILAWIYALTVPLGPIALLQATHRLAERQRTRLRKLGVDVPTPACPRRGGLRRLIDPWCTASTWRQAAFHLYAVAVDIPGGILVVAPRTARRVARLDALVGRVLLGPNRADRPTERVETLGPQPRGDHAATDAERRGLIEAPNLLRISSSSGGHD